MRNALGHRVGCISTFFNALEIFRDSVAAGHCPLRASAQHFVHLVFAELDRPGTADADRNSSEQCIRNFSLVRLQLVRCQSCLQRATPQEMSKPTPPAEITPPSSGSNAATPP